MTEPLLTVVTAAAGYDLVDLATVKDELGITNTTSDAKLTRWIAAISARIAGACNRVFPEEELTDTFRRHTASRVWGGLHHDPRPLLLSRAPVTVLDSVTIDGVAQDSGDRELDSRTGEIWCLSSGKRVRWGGQTIVVAYSAGYYPIPYDLQEAALVMIRHRWAQGNRDPQMRSFSIDGVGSEAYWVPSGGGAPGELPPDLQPIADVIEVYRRRAFA